MYTKKGAGEEWLLVQSDPQIYRDSPGSKVVTLEVKLSTHVLQVAFFLV